MCTVEKKITQKLPEAAILKLETFVDKSLEKFPPRHLDVQINQEP